MNQNTFANILFGLTDANNEIRKAAEAEFSKLHFDVQVQMLLNLGVQMPENVNLRMIIYVTLKVIFFRHEEAKTLSPNIVELCKINLANILISEKEYSLRKKALFAVTAFLSYLRDGISVPWPEMISYVHQMLFSGDALNKEIALGIISNAPFMFGEAVDSKFVELLPCFVECLQGAKANPKLAIQTIDTVGTLAQWCDVSVMNNNNIAPLVIEVSEFLLYTENATELVQILTQIVDRGPVLFSNHVELFLTCLLKVMNLPEADAIIEDVFELVIAYIESSAKLVQKYAERHLQFVVKCCFMFMAHIDDENLAQWLNIMTEDEDELADEYLHRATIGEIGLDRIACKVDSKIIFSFVRSEVDECFKSQNWKLHNAAILALGAVAEGCRDAVKKALPFIVDRLLGYFDSDNPRIVFSCLNTYGQFLIDFSGSFHKKFHQKVFVPILRIAMSYPHAKVQSNAILAFGNIIDGCQLKVLRNYSSDLFSILVASIERAAGVITAPGSVYILSNCLSALANLAKAFGEDFEYYEQSIRVTNLLMSMFASVQFINQFNEVIDCALGVLVAIGSEKAAPYLPEIMRNLRMFEELGSKTTKADEYRIFYFNLLEKISFINPEEMYPILNTLVPNLMTFFQQNIIDPNENSVTGQLSSEISGDYSSLYKTGLLEDKMTVCNLLTTLASTLPAPMLQFVPAILPAIFQVFLNVQNEDLICGVGECVLGLLKLCKLNGEQFLMGYWSTMNEGFYQKMYIIGDNAIVEYLDLMSSLCEVIGPAVMTQDQMMTFGRFMLKKLDAYITMAKLGDNIKAKVEEMEDFDLFNEEDWQITILGELQATSRSFFKVIGKPYTQLYQLILNSLFTLLGDSRHEDMRVTTLSFFVDILEFCPDDFYQFRGNVLPQIIGLLRDEDIDCVQLAVFVLGMLAQSGCAEYTGTLQQHLPLLYEYSNEDSLPNDYERLVRCNSVASIGRCLKFMPNLFGNARSSLQQWLQMLPIVEDEADFALLYVIELIEQDFNLVFANDRSNWMQILSAMFKMFLEVTDQTAKSAFAMFGKLQNSIGAQMDEAMASLDNVTRAEFNLKLKECTRNKL